MSFLRCKLWKLREVALVVPTKERAITPPPPPCGAPPAAPPPPPRRETASPLVAPPWVMKADPPGPLAGPKIKAPPPSTLQRSVNRRVAYKTPPVAPPPARAHDIGHGQTDADPGPEAGMPDGAPSGGGLTAAAEMRGKAKAPPLEHAEVMRLREAMMARPPAEAPGVDTDADAEAWRISSKTPAGRALTDT